VWSSISWQQVPATAFRFDENTFVTDAIGNGDGFVAVGYTLAKRTNVGRIWLSPDGRSWRLVESSAIGNLRPDRIVRVGNELVLLGTRLAGLAVDGPTEVWRSANGTTWTHGPTAPTSARFVAAGSDGILSAGHDTVMVLGPDLSSWTTVKRAVADDVLLGTPTGGEGLWIQPGATGIGDAGAVSTGAIWTSTDGHTWSKAPIEAPAGVVLNAYRVEGGYVAIGSLANVGCRVCFGPIVIARIAWFSADGSHWTRMVGSGGDGDDRIFGASFAGDGQRLLAFTDAIPRDTGTAPPVSVVSETIDGRAWTSIEIGSTGALPAHLNEDLTVGRLGVIELRAGVIDVSGGAPEAWWGQAIEAP
jgi:hypothetical protein